MKKTIVNFSPDWLSRHRLVTLLDMIEFSIEGFADVLTHLHAHQVKSYAMIQRGHGAYELGQADKRKISTLMARMIGVCLSLDCRASASRIRSLHILCTKRSVL